MTNVYFFIYTNSAQASFLLSFTPETAWFAALGFGGYNMWLATLMAFLGSFVGSTVTFGLGYYVSRWRERTPIYKESTYTKISSLFSRKLYLLMAIPPLFILEMMPHITIFVLLCGLFRVPPKKAITAIAVSRALYYAYYLL